jgi:DNA-binding MarR family transcriptional regulator
MAGARWYDDVARPALLRAARATYGAAIRTTLRDAGFDDIPRNGAFVLGAIARTGAPLEEVVRDLGTSEAAVGRLIDTLVSGGYLDRAADPDSFTLTERGTAAARAIRSAVDGVDEQLAKRVSKRHIADTRATLGALIAIGDEAGTD